MCLGVPGKIVEKYEVQGMSMGKVDFGGVTKEVCLAYVPDIELDRYVIVHVGFAITELDEQSAQETLDLFRELGVLDEELDPKVAEAEVDKAVETTSIRPS